MYNTVPTDNTLTLKYVVIIITLSYRDMTSTIVMNCKHTRVRFSKKKKKHMPRRKD